MESEAPNATPLPGRVPSTVHRFPGGYTPQSRARRPQRSPATLPLSISRRPLSNGRRSAEPEFADRLVAGRPRAEAVGEAVPDLERVDELHRGLDSLPAGPLEADEDGDPIRPLGDPLRDHLDLLPGLVEVGPPAPDALFALVDGLEAGEDAAGVILDLGMADHEQRIEVVLVPGAVTALGQLDVAGLRRHAREPIAPPRSVVLRPPAVERPDRQQDRADRDEEDRGVEQPVAGVGEGYGEAGIHQTVAGLVPGFGPSSTCLAGPTPAGSADSSGGPPPRRSSRVRPQPTTAINPNEIRPTPR